MKQRHGKRTVTLAYWNGYERPMLLPHRLIRFQLFCEKRGLDELVPVDGRLGARARVARRKPRAGRRRR